MWSLDFESQSHKARGDCSFCLTEQETGAGKEGKPCHRPRNTVIASPESDVRYQCTKTNAPWGVRRAVQELSLFQANSKSLVTTRSKTLQSSPSLLSGVSIEMGQQMCGAAPHKDVSAGSGPHSVPVTWWQCPPQAPGGQAVVSTTFCRLFWMSLERKNFGKVLTFDLV